MLFCRRPFGMAKFTAIMLSLWALNTGARERAITFLHIGDTHYNVRHEQFESQRQRSHTLIDAMNAMPGTPYPETMGDVVGKPMGVFVVGDLTEARQADFDAFAEDWGLVGGDGRLAFPVYEGAGNHDGPPSTREYGVVRRAIIRRNPHRPHLVSLSENGLHYSLDYGGVHFVQLNEYGGQDNDERYPGNRAYNRKAQSYGNPAEKSLQFLAATLAEHVGDSRRPVILFQHYGFDGWPLNPWGDELAWWTEEQALRLWEVIEGYNVMAILVGHDHSHNVMRWNGIPVYHMDAVRGFGVYQIAGEEMTRAVRLADNTWGPVHRQSIRIDASMPEELIQGPYLVYNDDPTQMTILWRTTSRVPVELRWGRQHFRYESGDITVWPHDDEHNLYRAILTDLEPNSRYVYRLRIQDKYAPGMFYSAPDRQADKVKFLIYGATSAGSAAHDRVSKAIYGKIYEDPAYHSFLLHVGNWVEDIAQIAHWDDQFFGRGEHLRHARYVQSRMPLLGTSGRHGGETTLFRTLFPYEYPCRTYHSFQYGPVHITVMDPYTDCAEGSDQYTWLVNDLQGAEAPWKILVFTGPHSWTSDDAAAVATRALLGPLCEKHGIRICIDGSTPGYARTRVGEIEYIGMGGGPASDGQSGTTLVLGAVHIEDNQLTLEVFDDTGKKIDSLVLPQACK
jgi:hypothetical protein